MTDDKEISRSFPADEVQLHLANKYDPDVAPKDFEIEVSDLLDDREIAAQQGLLSHAYPAPLEEPLGLFGPKTLPFDNAALEYLKLIILEEDLEPHSEARTKLREAWPTDDPEQYARWTVVYLAKVRDTSVRSVVSRMEEHSELAESVGWEDGPPHHSTVSRSVTLSEGLEEALEQEAHWARISAVRTGVAVPEHLKDDYGAAEAFDQEVTHKEKMDTAQEVLGRELAHLSPHISFDREKDVPSYKVGLDDIYALLAHMALEWSHAENGVQTLRWLELRDRVPEPATMFDYMREYSVKEIDDKFAAATGKILSDLDLPDTVNLAYDVTNVRWYGDETEHWPSGTKPKDNTSYAWQFAILSVAEKDKKVILGAHPIQSETQVAQYLRLFLRRIMTDYGLSPGRIYMDTQFYRKDIVTTCRNCGADFLIQGEDRGKVSDLLDEAPRDKPDKEPNIDFSDFPPGRKPNAFTVPVPPEELGAGKQNRDITAFLTDYDVRNRDLEGLGYQFRNRWRVETIIRQVKRRLHGRLNTSDARVRAWVFSTAVLYYNLLVWSNRLLPAVLSDPSVRLTGTELLHAVRSASWDARSGP